MSDVWMDVASAAGSLEVGPVRVRQLIDAGVLPADRFAGRWRLRRDDVERVAHQERGGRPYAPAVAWRVLGELDGELIVPAPDDRAQRARIRRYVEDIVDGRVGGLRRRGALRRLRVHRGLRSRLSNELVLGGVAVLDVAGGDRLVGDDDVVEGYVRASRVAGVESAYGLRPAEAPNVLLHVVADDLWPFPSKQRRAGRVVAAVDVLEASSDDRASRAARSVLRQAAAR